MDEFNRRIDRFRAERLREEQESRRRDRLNPNLSSSSGYRTSGFQPHNLLSSSPPPSQGEPSHKSFLPPPRYPSSQATDLGGTSSQKNDVVSALRALLQSLAFSPGLDGLSYRSLLLPPIDPLDPATSSSGANPPESDFLRASRALLQNPASFLSSSFVLDSPLPRDESLNWQHSGRNSPAGDESASSQNSGHYWGSADSYFPTTFLLPFDHPLNPPRSFAAFQKLQSKDEPTSSQSSDYHSDGAVTPDSNCSRAHSNPDWAWVSNFNAGSDTGSLKPIVHHPPRGRSRIPRASSDFSLTAPIVSHKNLGSSSIRGSAAGSEAGFAGAVPIHDLPFSHCLRRGSQSNLSLPLDVSNLFDFSHLIEDSEDKRRVRSSNDDNKAGPSTWKRKERVRSSKSKGKGKGKGKKQQNVPDTDEKTKAYVRGYNDAISDMKSLENSHKC